MELVSVRSVNQSNAKGVGGGGGGEFDSGGGQLHMPSLNYEASSSILRF